MVRDSERAAKSNKNEETSLQAYFFGILSRSPKDKMSKSSFVHNKRITFILTVSISLWNAAKGFSLDYVSSTGRRWKMSVAMSDDDAYEVETFDTVPTRGRKQKDVMSEAVPFLKCSPALIDCQYAGNVGFDPLGFAKNEEILLQYRESEMKHGRLAMLAAAGWPLSELFDRNVADYFGLAPVVDDSDRAPSVLNGGMDKISPVWWGFCVGLTAAIDLYGVSKSRSGEEDYFPGKLGFDPLGLYPSDRDGQERMELAEIKHGRVSMLAVVGYAVSEYVNKIGVVDETPIFFTPITETLPEMAPDL